MIYSTATLPVNPAGVPPLTREQIWKGLELKARDALLFIVLTLAKPKRRLKGHIRHGPESDNLRNVVVEGRRFPYDIALTLV